LHIEPQYRKIPIDTSASILTAGLLGEQYIGLEAGAEDEYLENNSQLDPGIAQSAVILEQLIGRLLYSMANNSTTAE
ncbi:toluene tolerance ABC transporter periplasmic substrate-binding protein, partial [Candidatus Thiomargarita nelsonii]